MKSLPFSKTISYQALLFTVLVIGFFVKIPFFKFAFADFWYDESVVTIISKQPISELLKTISAEPHPPGYYLFLKLLPRENPFLTKFYMTSISYFLVFASLLYAKRTGLLLKHRLSLGLALFFSSYTFLTITSDIKQDSLSFPLLLFFLFLFLKIADNVKGSVKEIFVINMLQVLLLFLGYVAYSWGLFMLLILFVYSKRAKLVGWSLILQVSVLILFLYFFGFDQIVLNNQRFFWFNEYRNSMLSALSTHLTGGQNISFATDLAILIILVPALYFYTTLKVTNLESRKKYYYLGLITLIVFLVSYQNKYFVRVRYSYAAFFLLSVFAGWGLRKAKSYKNIVVLLVILLFTLSLSGYAANKKSNFVFNQKIIKELEDFSANKTVGFITERGLYPHVIKLKHFRHKDSLIAIHALSATAFSGSDTIDSSHLKLPNGEASVPKKEVSKTISQSNLDSYAYLLFIRPSLAGNDNKIEVLEVLDEVCRNKRIKRINNFSFLFLYDACNV